MSVVYIVLILCVSDKGTSLKGLNVCEDRQRYDVYNITMTCFTYSFSFDMSLRYNSVVRWK